MSRLAIFAYGSLVNPASAAATLGRPVGIEGLARLGGWRRRWTLARDNLRSEKVFALADGSLPRWCVGLDISPGDGGEERAPNGAVIEVTEAELGRLDLREIRYDRVEVTDRVAGGGAESFDAIFAWMAKASNRHPEPRPDAVIIRTYLEAVEAAFGAHGAEQLALFRATTDSPPVPVVEATLVRDEIPPGNPRTW